eukprot:gene24709-31083_t
MAHSVQSGPPSNANSASKVTPKATSSSNSALMKFTIDTSRYYTAKQTAPKAELPVDTSSEECDLPERLMNAHSILHVSKSQSQAIKTPKIAKDKDTSNARSSASNISLLASPPRQTVLQPMKLDSAFKAKEEPKTALTTSSSTSSSLNNLISSGGAGGSSGGKPSDFNMLKMLNAALSSSQTKPSSTTGGSSSTNTTSSTSTESSKAEVSLVPTLQTRDDFLAAEIVRKQRAGSNKTDSTILSATAAQSVVAAATSTPQQQVPQISSSQNTPQTDVSFGNIYAQDSGVKAQTIYTAQKAAKKGAKARVESSVFQSPELQFNDIYAASQDSTVKSGGMFSAHKPTGVVSFRSPEVSFGQIYEGQKSTVKFGQMSEISQQNTGNSISSSSSSRNNNSSSQNTPDMSYSAIYGVPDSTVKFPATPHVTSTNSSSKSTPRVDYSNVYPTNSAVKFGDSSVGRSSSSNEVSLIDRLSSSQNNNTTTSNTNSNTRLNSITTTYTTNPANKNTTDKNTTTADYRQLLLSRGIHTTDPTGKTNNNKSNPEHDNVEMSLTLQDYRQILISQGILEDAAKNTSNNNTTSSSAVTSSNLLRNTNNNNVSATNTTSKAATAIASLTTSGNNSGVKSMTSNPLKKSVSTTSNASVSSSNSALSGAGSSGGKTYPMFATAAMNTNRVASNTSTTAVTSTPSNKTRVVINLLDPSDTSTTNKNNNNTTKSPSINILTVKGVEVLEILDSSDEEEEEDVKRKSNEVSVASKEVTKVVQSSGDPELAEAMRLSLMEYNRSKGSSSSASSGLTANNINPNTASSVFRPAVVPIVTTQPKPAPSQSATSTTSLFAGANPMAALKKTQIIPKVTLNSAVILPAAASATRTLVTPSATQSASTTATPHPVTTAPTKAPTPTPLWAQNATISNSSRVTAPANSSIAAVTAVTASAAKRKYVRKTRTEDTPTPSVVDDGNEESDVITNATTATTSSAKKRAVTGRRKDVKAEKITVSQLQAATEPVVMEYPNTESLHPQPTLCHEEGAYCFYEHHDRENRPDLANLHFYVHPFVPRNFRGDEIIFCSLCVENWTTFRRQARDLGVLTRVGEKNEGICALCSDQPEVVAVCDSADCTRSYCFRCLKKPEILNKAEMKEVNNKKKQWFCMVCANGIDVPDPTLSENANSTATNTSSTARRRTSPPPDIPLFGLTATAKNDGNVSKLSSATKKTKVVKEEKKAAKLASASKHPKLSIYSYSGRGGDASDSDTADVASVASNTDLIKSLCGEMKTAQGVVENALSKLTLADTKKTQLVSNKTGTKSLTAATSSEDLAQIHKALLTLRGDIFPTHFNHQQDSSNGAVQSKQIAQTSDESGSDVDSDGEQHDANTATKQSKQALQTQVNDSFQIDSVKCVSARNALRSLPDSQLHLITPLVQLALNNAVKMSTSTYISKSKKKKNTTKTTSNTSDFAQQRQSLHFYHSLVTTLADRVVRSEEEVECCGEVNANVEENEEILGDWTSLLTVITHTVTYLNHTSSDTTSAPPHFDNTKCQESE